MLEPIPFDADNIVGLRVAGRIEAGEFDKIAAIVEDKLSRHPKLRVYVEVPSFDGISIEAFFKDLQMGLRHWHRFEKEAVVTDQAWLQRITAFTGHLVPGLEVRAFPTTDKAAARAWIEAA